MRRVLIVFLLLVRGPILEAQTESPKPAYEFSLPRQERIKLAERAAPPEISGKATVYLLERTGYVRVREATNGFSCFVDRQTPLNLEPTCFDAEGRASTLVTRLLAEELRAKGKGEQEVIEAMQDGCKTRRFRAPQKPGIDYTQLSKSRNFRARCNSALFQPTIPFPNSQKRRQDLPDRKLPFKPPGKAYDSAACGSLPSSDKAARMSLIGCLLDSGRSALSL
jgi:hypothetical protein